MHSRALQRNCVLSVDTVSALVRLATRRGLVLTTDMVAMLHIPNSPASFSCFAWMDSYFKTVGDCIPNSDGELHLEPITIKEVWTEYSTDFTDLGERLLDVREFGSMWLHCFPYVKIREFKAVTGKCLTCAELTHARRTFKDKASRGTVTYMHALHRMMYMNERKSYALRRNQAYELPEMHMSIISDGMAQAHCMLPWFSNQYQFGDYYVPQHLQGVLNHARQFTFYRTFHNVTGGGAFQLHCFLLELDYYYDKDGKLPDTIYYQIDGGSENIAKTVLAMMELLVAKRLTKMILLTRLPVGHTHEDIDARYVSLKSTDPSNLPISPHTSPSLPIPLHDFPSLP